MVLGGSVPGLVVPPILRKLLQSAIGEAEGLCAGRTVKQECRADDPRRGIRLQFRAVHGAHYEVHDGTVDLKSREGEHVAAATSHPAENSHLPAADVQERWRA